MLATAFADPAASGPPYGLNPATWSGLARPPSAPSTTRGSSTSATASSGCTSPGRVILVAEGDPVQPAQRLVDRPGPAAQDRDEPFPRRHRVRHLLAADAERRQLRAEGHRSRARRANRPLDLRDVVRARWDPAPVDPHPEPILRERLVHPPHERLVLARIRDEDACHHNSMTWPECNVETRYVMSEPSLRASQLPDRERHRTATRDAFGAPHHPPAVRSAALATSGALPRPR